MDIDSLNRYWLKQYILAILILLLSGFGFVQSSMAQSTSDKDKYLITGHLWSIKTTEKQVTVMNKNNKATIKFDKSTKININGNYTDKNKSSYHLDDLKIGDYVRITYYLDGNSKIALKVIAARY